MNGIFLIGIVNPTSEPIKLEIPVFDEEWIQEHRDLGLEVIPVTKNDNYLSMWKRAHAKLDKIRPKNEWLHINY